MNECRAKQDKTEQDKKNRRRVRAARRSEVVVAAQRVRGHPCCGGRRRGLSTSIHSSWARTAARRGQQRTPRRPEGEICKDGERERQVRRSTRKQGSGRLSARRAIECETLGHID